MSAVAALQYSTPIHLDLEFDRWVEESRPKKKKVEDLQQLGFSGATFHSSAIQLAPTVKLAAIEDLRDAYFHLVREALTFSCKN